MFLYLKNKYKLMNRILNLFNKGTDKVLNKGVQEDLERGLPDLQRLINAASTATSKAASKARQLAQKANSADLADWYHGFLEVRDALDMADSNIDDADREMTDF